MEPEQTANNTTKYVIGLVAIVLIIIGVSIYGSGRITPDDTSDETTKVETPATTSTETTKTSVTSKTFTLAEVATHSTKDSCYSSIRGTVYDLTAWIYKHPGGANNILKICGKDGTNAFTGKHEGEPKPEQILAGFEIGTLAK